MRSLRVFVQLGGALVSMYQGTDSHSNFEIQ